MNNETITRILKRRERKKLLYEHKPFESSSVGDIAFLLLIYFIVTSSFILRQGIFFSLPSPNAGAVSVQPERIVEIIPENNGYLYRGEPVTRIQVKDILNKKKQDEKKIIMLIRMRPDVRYEMLVDALSIARETGITEVSVKDYGKGT